MEIRQPIKLAERRVFSDSFKPLYNEGMSLVEHAAGYLDGPGRAEARKLSRMAATLYAAESMRLTTRLMQIASWLLLQRAANSGEMTRDQVATEKTKVRDGLRIVEGQALSDVGAAIVTHDGIALMAEHTHQRGAVARHRPFRIRLVIGTSSDWP